MFTETVKERDSIAAFAAPQSLNNASLYTTGVDMSLFNRVSFELAVGVGAGNLAGSIVQSANSNMAGNTAVSGATLVAITNAPNTYYTLECRSDQLTQRYVAGLVTESAVVATTVSVVGRATVARYGPQGSDVNTVKQRVVV